jgi:hypothetical protein
MNRLHPLWLGLLLGACAHQPETPDDSATAGQQAEIASLEKRISQKSAALSRANASPASQSSDGEASDGDETAGGGPCDSLCQTAQELCSLQRRLCQLVTDRNSPPGADSCRRAEQKCSEGGRLCAGCR